MVDPALTVLSRALKNPGVAIQLEAEIDELPREQREGLIRRLIQIPELPELQPESPIEERFKIRSMCDALKPKPPIDWRVESLFQAGTVNLVVGQEGTKKTYTLLDLAMCHALGKSWLGMPTKQGAVLFIDEESGYEELERRLEIVAKGHLADETTPVYYLSYGQFDLRTQEDLSILEAKVLETGAKLVIIDALMDIMPGGDENSVKDVNPIFHGLRVIATKTQAAIILIHHTNNNGGVRGSSAIRGAVGVILKVESEADKPVIDFKTEKNRHGKALKFSALAHWLDGQFWLSSCEGEEPGEKKLSPSQSYVIRTLAQHGELSVKDIGSYADTVTPEAAGKAVRTLAGAGITYRTNPGATGRGNEALYALTEKGRLLGDKL